MVNVYNFKLWDAGSGTWVYSAQKATSSQIKKHGGKIIIGTNEKIDPSDLDADGNYCRLRARSNVKNIKTLNKHSKQEHINCAMVL